MGRGNVKGEKVRGRRRERGGGAKGEGEKKGQEEGGFYIWISAR